jgi:hypothetical protein
MDTYQLLLPMARLRDPLTSHMAGANAQGRVTGQKLLLLEAFRQWAVEGLTDEQAATLAGLVDRRACCWWKRCSDLRELKLIKPTGARRRSTVGEWRMVCKITPEGLDVFEESER